SRAPRGEGRAGARGAPRPRRCGPAGHPRTGGGAPRTPAARPPPPSSLARRTSPALGVEGDGPVHDGLQLLVVRALPVRAPALGALREHVVRAVRTTLELVGDLLLGRGAQQPVAGGAPAPGPQLGPEPVEHVLQLLLGPGA